MLRISLAIICALSLPTTLHAQQDEKPWWNPMSLMPSSQERSSDFFNKPKAKSDSFFGIPKPSWMQPKAKKATGLNAMQRFTKSTKKLWSDTADFVNPFDKPAPTKNYLGKNVGYSPKTKESTESGPFSWLYRETKTESPQSVSDWLRQPNPLSSPQAQGRNTRL